MLKRIRLATAAALLVASAAGVTLAAQKGGARAPIAGEDDFRSVTAHAVALMEHCKMVHKLAKSRGDLNVGITREHAAETARSAEALARHFDAYMSLLPAEQRTLVADAGGIQQAASASVVRLAGELTAAVKAASPDRKVVGERATELYLAAKQLLAAHKAAGKTLKISAASPPRKPSPRKPRKPKMPAETALNGQ